MFIRKLVISNDNLPRKFPVVALITWWMLLDRLNPPGWVWGVALTLLGIGALAQLFYATTQVQVDIFKKEK